MIIEYDINMICVILSQTNITTQIKFVAITKPIFLSHIMIFLHFNNKHTLCILFVVIVAGLVQILAYICVAI